MPDPQLVFRRARLADLPAIVAMLADDELGAARENPSLPLDPRYTAAFGAIAQDCNQFLAVLERDGSVVGCLQLSFIPGLSRLGQWRGQIESVRIASSARGAGLGRAMFEWAIEQCRVQGCSLVQLTTDRARPDARRFYESLGFKASHDGMKLSL
ncbi:GNAT family acetyltransferase [Achromobacter sp. HZ01]|jgi:ribosomal protein S18 acetylase RimI-like enzyme|uniref:GNAT family N-acetyltransferase n=1 Tax=Achromobacter sp. HZ01 TaxID=1416886 RepID=UPI000DC51EAB|nr:GNAT family N-acetyltransferase [Achromobacter sp. HZ01]MBO9331062.1 GNAT family N-acetyltransferase [Achromobacter xylosoxidans]RAP65567.1 GNAT family acetyltransferase [Achromobacter sp. HZ01]